jgi:hypothetical protein
LRTFIKTIREFGENEKIFSGKEVWNYFYNLPSRHHSKYDDPVHQYKEQILNNKYRLEDVLIDDLLKYDVDLKDYVDTQICYYEECKDKVKTYGLIGDSSFSKNVLIDGYHRLLQKIINGDKTFKVFVPIK